MVFGLLTTKLQIFQNPLFVSLCVRCEVLECFSWLHNNCIDMKFQSIGMRIAEITTLTNSLFEWEFLPRVGMFEPSVHGKTQICDAILGMASQHRFWRLPIELNAASRIFMGKMWCRHKMNNQFFHLIHAYDVEVIASVRFGDHQDYCSLLNDLPTPASPNVPIWQDLPKDLQLVYLIEVTKIVLCSLQ